MQSWIRRLFQAHHNPIRNNRRPNFRPRLESLESRLSPAIYNVTGFADGAGGISGSGPFMATTLRAAIVAANANPDSDIINLAAGTYTVNNSGLGELAITQNV